MAFIDVLEKAGDSFEASYIKFLHQYKFRDKTLHFFFEGLDDQSFYANYLESTFPDNYEFNYYVCNGKDNVYSNYKNINWTVYNKNRVLFFTDKDLDDIIGVTNVKDENIFETQYYSIENYLVTAEVYGRFLREICYITESEVISKLKTEFINQLSSYSEKMTSISAWVVYCRKNNLPVNLSDIDISKIFSISKDFKIKRDISSGHNTPFEYICSVTKTNYYDLKEIKEISTALQGIIPAKNFIRGKYELWFLYAFCKNTIENTIPSLNEEIKKHNSTNRIKKTKCKVTISLKPENIIQITAPRARISKDISDFLNHNLNKITNA
ncbi:MAG: DUF4435 domain-containing protein [Paludibacter sp.]|nr:DUF4435 domain-containing protein [Paludibacter sp.]